jgi:hypothetical protein
MAPDILGKLDFYKRDSDFYSMESKNFSAFVLTRSWGNNFFQSYLSAGWGT